MNIMDLHQLKQKNKKIMRELGVENRKYVSLFQKLTRGERTITSTQAKQLARRYKKVKALESAVEKLHKQIITECRK